MTILFILEKFSHVKRILELYNNNLERDKWGNNKGYIIYLNNKYIFVPCVGSMHVLNNMHTLVKEYNVDLVIRVGTCGIMSLNVSLGQVVLVKKTINKDAISERYFPNDKPIVCSKFVDQIKNSLGIESKTAYTVDVLWDKPDKRADVVDMESSALYCYGNHNNVDCISISVCRDNSTGALSREKTEDTIRKVVQAILKMFEG